MQAIEWLPRENRDESGRIPRGPLDVRARARCADPHAEGQVVIMYVCIYIYIYTHVIVGMIYYDNT